MPTAFGPRRRSSIVARSSAVSRVSSCDSCIGGSTFRTRPGLMAVHDTIRKLYANLVHQGGDCPGRHADGAPGGWARTLARALARVERPEHTYAWPSPGVLHRSLDEERVCADRRSVE